MFKRDVGFLNHGTTARVFKISKYCEETYTLLLAEDENLERILSEQKNKINNVLEERTLNLANQSRTTGQVSCDWYIRI